VYRRSGQSPTETCCSSTKSTTSWRRQRADGLFVVAENGNQGPRTPGPATKSVLDGPGASYRTPTVSPVIADNGISAVEKVPF